MKDYHLHTNFGDGKNTVDEMVAAASQAGFKEIAFTEHLTLEFIHLREKGIVNACTIMPKDINAYLTQCREAEQKHGIKVLKGFELGYLERNQEEAKRLVEQVNPDILLLSVHHLELLKDWTRTNGRIEKEGYSLYLGGSAFEEMVRQYGGFENVCRAYFTRLQNAANAGFENLCPRVGIAHLNMFDREPSYDGSAAQPQIDETIGIIAQKGIALEVNFHYSQSSGSEHTRPTLRDAKRFLVIGGKDVWFGSDSHSVDEVAMAAQWCRLFEERIK